MSEYQYYEFQAIDRPLTKVEMADLRTLSTRAMITPNRFQNVYNYGDFRGDPDRVLAQYFDAHVYVTNWGVYQLMFRLPRETVDRARVSLYEVDPCLRFWTSGNYDIIAFMSDDQEGGGWIDDEDSEAWLPALLPLRSDLMEGDERSLYLAWLVAVQFDHLEVDPVEPPVPPGLGSLSEPLQTFVNFLQLDPDLLAVAAEASGTRIEQQPSPDALRDWAFQLPEADKNDVLSRLITSDETPAPLRTELLRRYRQEHPPAVEPATASRRRTSSELFERANARAEARRHEEAERTTRARNTVLDTLAVREDDAWDDVELLIASKQQANYDRAVATLIDLRDLARRGQSVAFFTDQLRELRKRHAPKSSFIRRLNQAGL